MAVEHSVRSSLKALARQFTAGGTLRFDFETWLVQTYGIKAKDLDKKALKLAKEEYSEEYPQPGEGEMKLKTYPFKKYLESKTR